MAITYAIEAELNGIGGGWTDLTADCLDEPAFATLKYGIFGGGPEDLVAETGTLDFAMANSATPGSSVGAFSEEAFDLSWVQATVPGRPLGYYSPGHPQCRPGWTWEIRVRLSVYDGASLVTRKLCYLDDIKVTPGKYDERNVPCVAVDYLEHLATAPPDVPAQVAQTDAEIVNAILDAAIVPPAARSIAAGVDTYPYAMDRQAGTLLAACQDLCLSSRGYLYAKRDAVDGETVTYESRTTRQVATSAVLSLGASTLTKLQPADRSVTFDRLRVTCHPRRIVGAGSMAGPVAQEEAVPATPLGPGQTETIWLDYTDPAQRDTRIAAANVISPVATTDYAFNTAADGTGTDLTASVTVVATPFAESVKVDITNTHATLSAYRTRLQLRGDGIYTLADVTVQAKSGAGTRFRVLDMPYQDDPSVAQGVADSLVPLYVTPTSLVETASCDGDRDAAMLAAVLACDIGDSIDVFEEVTGISLRCFVQGIEWLIGPRDRLAATFWLAPATAAAWVLGTSSLDFDARLGA